MNAHAGNVNNLLEFSQKVRGTVLKSCIIHAWNMSLERIISKRSSMDYSARIQIIVQFINKTFIVHKHTQFPIRHSGRYFIENSE